MKVHTEYGVFLLIFSILFENVNCQSPENLKAELLDNQIKVTWSPLTDTNPFIVSHYELLIKYPTTQTRQYNTSDTAYCLSVNNDYGIYRFAVQAYYTNGVVTGRTPYFSLKVDRTEFSPWISTLTTIQQKTVPSTPDRAAFSPWISTLTAIQQKTVPSTPAAPPTPGIEQSRHPVVGSDHLLACNPGSSIVLQYQWKINGQIIQRGTHKRFMVNESELIIHTITKSDNDTVVQCIVTTTTGQSDSSPMFMINPRYGPDLMTLHPSAKKYNVTENGNIGPIICSAECYPKCSIRWRFKPIGGILTDFRDGESLEIRQITQYQSGEYKCVAKSSYKPKRNKIHVNIVVRYKPNITQIELRNNSGRHELKEGQSLVLLCSVNSVPLSNISWTRANDNLLLKVNRNRSNSTYTVEKASCHDSDTYICEATNGIGSVVKKNITINVRCSPHESTKHRKTRIDSFEREIGSNVSFTVNAVGYPHPEVEWFYKYNVSTHKKKLTQTNRINFTRLGEQFSLNIETLDANDFGIYLLELSNTEGNITFNFSLQAKALSSSPTESNIQNGSELGQIIGVVTASTTLMILLAITLIAVVHRRRTIPGKKTDGVSRDGTNQLDHDENPISEISNQRDSQILRENKSKALKCGSKTYDMSNGNGTSSGENHPSNDKTKARHSYTYAEVQKPKQGTKAFDVIPTSGGSDGPMDYTYAKVVKSQEKHGQSEDDEIARIEEASSSSKSHSGAERKTEPTKKDEANSVGLDCLSPGKESNNFVINGLENKTTYSLVDFTKHANHLPDSYDENDQDDKQNKSDNITEDN